MVVRRMVAKGNDSSPRFNLTPFSGSPSGRQKVSDSAAALAVGSALSYDQASRMMSDFSATVKPGESKMDAARRLEDRIRSEVEGMIRARKQDLRYPMLPVATRVTITPSGKSDGAYNVVVSPIAGDPTLEPSQLLGWALTMAAAAPEPGSGVVVSQIPAVHPAYQIKVPGSDEPLDLGDPEDVAMARELLQSTHVPLTGDGSTVADSLNRFVTGATANVKDFWSDLSPTIKTIVKGAAVAAVTLPLVKGLFRSLVPASYLAALKGNQAVSQPGGIISSGGAADGYSDRAASNESAIDGTMAEEVHDFGSIGVPVGFWLTLRKLGDSYAKRTIDAPFYAAASAPIGGSPDAVSLAVAPRVWVDAQGNPCINPALYAAGPLAGGFFDFISKNPLVKKVVSKTGTGLLSLAKNIPGVGTIVSLADGALGLSKGLDKWGSKQVTPTPPALVPTVAPPSLSTTIAPNVAQVALQATPDSSGDVTAEQVAHAVAATKAQEVFDKSPIMANSGLSLAETISSVGGIKSIASADESDKADAESANLRMQVALAGAPIQGFVWVWPAVKMVATWGIPIVASWLVPKMLDKANAKKVGGTKPVITFVPANRGSGVSVNAASAAAGNKSTAVGALSKLGALLGKMPAIIKGVSWAGLALGAVWFVVSALSRSKKDQQAFEENVSKSLPPRLVGLWNKLREEIDLSDVSGVATSNQEQYIALVQVAVVAATYRHSKGIATESDVQLLDYMKSVADQVSKLDPDTLAHVNSLTSDFLKAMPEGTPDLIADGSTGSASLGGAFGSTGFGDGQESGDSSAPSTAGPVAPVSTEDLSTQAIEDLNAVSARDPELDSKIFSVFGTAVTQDQLKDGLMKLGLTAASVAFLIFAWNKAVAKHGSKDKAIKAAFGGIETGATYIGEASGQMVSSVARSAWNFLNGLRSSMVQNLRV